MSHFEKTRAEVLGFWMRHRLNVVTRSILKISTHSAVGTETKDGNVTVLS